MTRRETASITAGLVFVILWLAAMAMGAAAESRAQYNACIDAGESTLFCSQGYEPSQINRTTHD